MKAWVCRRYGKSYELEIANLPERLPQTGEVLVEIRAAGVNFGERLVLSGEYQIRPPLPYIFGVDGSGVVLACGEGVSRFRPGDEVVIQNSDMTGGCCAERITLSERLVFAKPPRLSFAQAAALSPHFTVFHAFRRRAPLRRGEVLVVHGASGGIGLAAVQIGKARGATVVGVGGSDEKLKMVTAQGADHVVNYNACDVKDEIRRLTGGRGADVICDPVGGAAFEASMRAIAPGGRVLIMGFTSGRWEKAATNIVLVKMISIIGIEPRAFLQLKPDLARADIERVLRMAEEGRVDPVVGKTFRFEDLEEAFHAIETRSLVGRAVLDCTRAATPVTQ